jgi:replicative DNA helicase
MLSDLRESGSIEQDADTVTFVYRPEYYKEDGYVTYDGYCNFDHGTAFAIVAKQREGPTGEVEFCYDRTLSKIWDGEDRRPYPARPPIPPPQSLPFAPDTGGRTPAGPDYLPY